MTDQGHMRRPGSLKSTWAWTGTGDILTVVQAQQCEYHNMCAMHIFMALICIHAKVSGHTDAALQKRQAFGKMTRQQHL